MTGHERTRVRGPGEGGFRRTWIRLVQISLLAGVAIAAPTWVAAAVVAEARAALDRLEKATAPVRDFEAEFVQIRHVALTDETVEASGRLRFLAPDHFRLDYSSPDPDILAIRSDTLVVFFSRMKQAQRYRLSDDPTSRGLFLLFSSEPGRLARSFDISPAPPSPSGSGLRLQPLAGSGPAAVTEIQVFADARSGLPRRLFFREEGGDTVIFELRKAKTNRKLRSSDFELRLPGGTELINREGTGR